MKLRRAGSFSRLMSHDSRRDQSVRVWSLPEGKPVRTLNNHTKAIHDLALRPQSSGLPMIATVSNDRTVRLWQTTIGRMVRFVRLPAAGGERGQLRRVKIPPPAE